MMTFPPPADLPASAPNSSRIVIGTLLVGCLTGGPFVSLSKWVAEIPASLERWPYVFTVWVPLILGSAMFMLDVVAPIAARGAASAEMLLVAMAAPIALGLWALASAFWTESPATTPQQAVLLMLAVFTGIWFGYALTFRQQVVSLFVGLHVIVAVSVVLAATLTSARLGDDWIGLLATPDQLSPVAGLGMIAAIGAILLSRSLRLKMATGVLVVADVVVVWQTASTSGLLALCGATIAFALVLLVRGLTARRSPPATTSTGSGGGRVALAMVVGAALLAVHFVIQLFADSLDEDSALAQRADVWRFVFDAVADRWIVGFGFQSFWDTVTGSGSDPTAGVMTGVLSAHSTFVDTLLYLGSIGLLLLVVVVIFGVGRVWWEALGGQSWAMGWWAAVATFVLLVNLTESLMAQHSVFWIVLVAPGFAAMRYSAAMSTTPALRPDRPTSALSSYTYQ